MKKVYCTVGGSMNDTCHISTVFTAYPANWPRSTRQDECHSIDDIKKFIDQTSAKFVMFAVRARGVPNGAVKVSDAEKLEKAFKKFEKAIDGWRDE